MLNAQAKESPLGKIASARVWLLIIGFIVHWIYLYDVCKAEGNGQIGCLIGMLFVTYFEWLLWAIVGLVHLVTNLL